MSRASDPLASAAEAVLRIREGAEAGALRLVADLLGRRAVIRSDDSADGALAVDQLQGDTLTLFPRLGVVVVRAEADQLRRLRALDLAAGPVEEVVVASTALAAGVGAVHAERVIPTDLSALVPVADAPLGAVEGPAGYRDDDRGTWGLHATGVLRSRYSGRGVRVAALVDGLDTSHPDWKDREVVARSFVAGEPPTGGGGLGTHYLGTALGTAAPASGERYGCAPDAVPYVARVLDRNGMGLRLAMLAALEWAVANGCRVILIPLGSEGPFDPLVERLASLAAARGGLSIAGAGSNARRSGGHFGSVTNPAACPSVVAAGSVGARLELPEWSPRSSGGAGGDIDLVAPGVALRSSVQAPRLYERFSGSATAAAYAAGIAALWAEARPAAGALELRRALVLHASPLMLPATDAGAGMVQAP